MKPLRVRVRRPLAALGTVLVVVASGILGVAAPASAASYVPISGAGSTWSYNAINTWLHGVQQYAMRVNYTPNGSTNGRQGFKEGTVDFAASDIPYGIKDGTRDDPPPAPPAQRGFAYMPVTAGGTTFMYNLKIGTSRVTNLRLSGENLAKIFTGVLTRWNDPAIAADNPGLRLPARKIVPVVRSDGSGSTAQFTQWMIATQGQYWTAYCAKVGRDPCTQTSAYPVLNGSGMVAQAGDLGVSGYVQQAQAVGTIGYVEYSYAIQAGFPVAKVLNLAGYYTEPTAGHVAVSLLAAKINPNRNDPRVYLTQDLSQVYVNGDPRTYELSSYSYMILPIDTNNGFTANKGYTLGDFGKYALCEGQTKVDALGYSALPINLVEAGMQQLQKIPGNHVPTATSDFIQSCNNPTFSTDGTNTLAKNDPNPQPCDRKGPTQCATGTGGARQNTPVVPGTGGGGTGSGSGTGAVNPSTSASAAAAAAAAAAANCDPDSGTCDQAGGGSVDAASDQQVPGVAVNASANFGDTFEIVLMVVAGILLLGIGLVPPLIAQGSRRRRNDGLGGWQ
jgi:phosphate ABC transporter phosphate-binding protein